MYGLYRVYGVLWGLNGLYKEGVYIDIYIYIYIWRLM